MTINLTNRFINNDELYNFILKKGFINKENNKEFIKGNKIIKINNNKIFLFIKVNNKLIKI